MLRVEALVDWPSPRRGDCWSLTGSRCQHHRSLGRGLQGVAGALHVRRGRCRSCLVSAHRFDGPPDVSRLRLTTPNRADLTPSRCIRRVSGARSACRRCAPWSACGARYAVAWRSSTAVASSVRGANEWSVISMTTTRVAYLRRHAVRHWTCSSSVGESRSTPKWTCFTTFSAAVATSTTREVTLYLALPASSYSRLDLPGPAPCSAWSRP